MSHLTLEALARLVDEPPAPPEAEHLAACEACRAELEGLRADAAELARLGPIEPPATLWPRLRRRIERERLLAPPRPWTPALLRLAAALAIFALGAAAGAAVRGAAMPAARVATTSPPESAGAPSGRTAAGAPDPGRLPGEAATTGAVAMAPPAPAPDATPTAASTPSTANPPTSGSPLAVAAADAPQDSATPEQVARALATAEHQYLQALSRYAELSGPPPGSDVEARLAALESIVLTTGAALDQAPADPVINGYHLAALAQRNAAIRQVALQAQPWF